MKFTAAREALLKPLQAVIGVVERRQTMPPAASITWVWSASAILAAKPTAGSRSPG